VTVRAIEIAREPTPLNGSPGPQPTISGERPIFRSQKLAAGAKRPDAPAARSLLRDSGGRDLPLPLKLPAASLHPADAFGAVEANRLRPGGSIVFNAETMSEELILFSGPCFHLERGIYLIRLRGSLEGLLGLRFTKNLGVDRLREVAISRFDEPVRIVVSEPADNVEITGYRMKATRSLTLDSIEIDAVPIETNEDIGPPGPRAEALNTAHAVGAPVPPVARRRSPKTLVFCTAFSHVHDYWDARYGLWVKALQSSGLEFDTILMVDDGSSTVPDWPGLAVWTDAEPLPHLDELPEVILYRFQQRLGRRSVVDFPGWHRSFTFAGKFAEAYGFEKVIHIESDCFLVSERIQRYVNDLRAGWTAMWSPRYEFAESAIQIVAGDAMRRFQDFEQILPQQRLVNHGLEDELPLDIVEMTFKGDRYGEYLDHVPQDADYIAQVRAEQPPQYFWWLDLGDESRVPVLTEFSLTRDRALGGVRTKAPGEEHSKTGDSPSSRLASANSASRIGDAPDKTRGEADSVMDSLRPA